MCVENSTHVVSETICIVCAQKERLSQDLLGHYLPWIEHAPLRREICWEDSPVRSHLSPLLTFSFICHALQFPPSLASLHFSSPNSRALNWALKEGLQHILQCLLHFEATSREMAAIWEGGREETLDKQKWLKCLEDAQQIVATMQVWAIPVAMYCLAAPWKGQCSGCIATWKTDVKW